MLMGRMKEESFLILYPAKANVKLVCTSDESSPSA